jgi:hypothetical protein
MPVVHGDPAQRLSGKSVRQRSLGTEWMVIVPVGIDPTQNVFGACGVAKASGPASINSAHFLSLPMGLRSFGESSDTRSFP